MTSVELLAYCTLNGLTVADLKKLSIGYVIDYVLMCRNIKNKEDLHDDEDKFHKLKDILPFAEQKYKDGKISKERYELFLADYKEKEELYGSEYD